MSQHVTLSPGIGVTVFGSLPGDLRPDVIAACDHVTLHTAADAGDVRNAARVRALGCERVRLAIPANYLVRLANARGEAAAVAEVERCARVALDMGAELFELNGEGSSDGEKPGDWIAPADAPAETERLERLAEMLFEAIVDVLGDACAAGWTSHDGTGFRIPRRFLRLIDLHRPQHYPALPHEKGKPPPPRITQRGLEKRVAWSLGQWDGLATRGKVPGDVVPYGPRWAMYTQAHGLTLGALVWALCEHSDATLWAFPGSWDELALRALKCARVIRNNVDVTKPDVIERWQTAKALDVDGSVGPATIGAAEACL